MSDTDEQSLAELRAIRRVLVYVAIMLSAIIFYFGKEIIMPVVLGLLITMTLSPVVRFLQKLKIPAPVGALLVVLLSSGVLYGGLTTLTEPLGELFKSLPTIGERMVEHLRPYQNTIDEISNAGDQVQDLAGSPPKQGVSQVVVEGPSIISSAASTVATGLTSLFIALLLSVFILGSGNLFYEKLVSSIPRLSDKKRALRIVYDIESNVSHYLFTITLINIVLGVCIAALLYAYGSPSFLLWGVIAAVFNFLPFMGAVIGALLLATASLGVFDTLGAALIPPVIYYACSALEGNVITPYIVGRRLQVNIVAVFLSVAFWGWLWGLAGALMAVPILVFINVLCEHIPSLKSLGTFISGRSSAAELGPD